MRDSCLFPAALAGPIDAGSFLSVRAQRTCPVRCLRAAFVVCQRFFVDIRFHQTAVARGVVTAQELAGIGLGICGDFCRPSLTHYPPAVFAALGS